MKIIIVNDKDEIIDYKERNILNDEKDIYRVSALWITNKQGEILLAKRSFKKLNNPGKWGPAVAGTNDIGESYRSNIIKEADEELGLKNIKPKKLIKDFKNGEHKHFTQWFCIKLDKNISDFKYDNVEVEEIRWFTKEEILLLDDNELIKGMKEFTMRPI